MGLNQISVFLRRTSPSGRTSASRSCCSPMQRGAVRRGPADRVVAGRADPARRASPPRPGPAASRCRRCCRCSAIRRSRLSATARCCRSWPAWPSSSWRSPTRTRAHPEERRSRAAGSALMIDASSSMLAPFKAARLGPNAPSDATIFHRASPRRRLLRPAADARQVQDLMALFEFGDESYVITPFTHDYDNILLSISLIGDPTEWRKFPEPGDADRPGHRPGPRAVHAPSISRRRPAMCW